MHMYIMYIMYTHIYMYILLTDYILHNVYLSSLTCFPKSAEMAELSRIAGPLTNAPTNEKMKI